MVKPSWDNSGALGAAQSCHVFVAAIGPGAPGGDESGSSGQENSFSEVSARIVNFECRFLCYITYITAKCTLSVCSLVSSSVLLFGGKETHWDRDSWGDLATDTTPRCEFNTVPPQRRNATAQPAQRRRHGAKGDSKCFQSCDLGTDSSCSGKTWDGWVITLNIFNISLIYWLVVWNIGFSCFHLLGISSSQLTNSYFSEG